MYIIILYVILYVIYIVNIILNVYILPVFKNQKSLSSNGVTIHNPS